MWRRLSIIIIAAGLTAQGLLGQSKTNSPYSIFGVGDFYSSGYIQYPEYGGAATGLLKKNKINFSNPATYRAIDSMRFVIDFGFNSKFKQLSDQNTTQISKDFNFSYYAVGFRITRWLHTSIGLSPVSNRNYRIRLSQTGSDETYYIGSGNLNKAYIGQSVSILPNLSLGYNVNYTFGEFVETKTILYPNTNFARNTQEGYSKQIQDVSFNTGVMYTHKPSEDKKWNIGLTYAPEQEINYKEDYLFGATTGNSLEDISDNTILDTSKNYTNKKRSFKIPHTFSIGLSYEDYLNQTATLEFNYALWDEADNTTIENTRTKLNNSFKVSGGYSFIPKWNSASSYFERTTYVFGAFFERQYMDIENENINAFALSAGIGMPIKRVGAMINVGIELGQRGTLNNELISEQYIKLNLKFNFKEVWFFEKKYD